MTIERKKKKADNRPTGLVFCCGGGLTTGAIKEEGFNVLGGIDNWDFAEKIYKMNFPDCKFYLESLRALTPKSLCDKFGIVPGKLDFIQISNPCTGASSLGDGEPMEAVNDLFFVCMALAFALRPKVILFENVTGMLRSDMEVLLGMFWAFLQRTGVEYNIDAMVLNSWLYGDPQSRNRVFIQCVRKDVGQPVWPQSIPMGDRTYVRDVIPDAEYISSRNYGPRVFYDFEPAPTITAHPDLMVYNGIEDRKVTPREYARFMGLPDWYQLDGAIADQVKLLGNGVPWNVTRKLVAAIRYHVLGMQPPDSTENITVMSELPTPINRPLDSGFVLYQGSSQIDGQEIVAILTLHSRNKKTGDMAQLWILNANQPPLEAAKSGHDRAICGDCSLKQSENGVCYVNLGKAPTTIWNAWKEGHYPSIDEDRYGQIKDLVVRLGAYGDPAALPLNILVELLNKSVNHTSYTHLWRTCSSDLQEFSMASINNAKEYSEAVDAGWRTFRIINEGDKLMENEIMCPHPKSGVQCKDCKLCSGNKLKAKNIAIEVHGKGKSNYSSELTVKSNNEN